MFNEPRPMLSPADVEAWQQREGITIPNAYQTFLLKYGASSLSQPMFFAMFFAEGFGTAALDCFFDLDDSTTSSDGTNSLSYAVKAFADALALGYFPIAREAAGGLLLLHDDKVYFWHHETALPDDLYVVADDLETFFESLEPEPKDRYSMLDLFDEGRDEDIKHLLESGWDVNTPLELGQSALQRAALLQKHWLVQDLVMRGAILEGALEMCLTHNNLESFEYLLKQGANPNELSSMDVSLLMTVVIEKKSAFVSLLLKHGADTAWQDEFGRTALDVAKKKAARGDDGLTDIIDLLSQAEA